MRSYFNKNRRLPFRANALADLRGGAPGTPPSGPKNLSFSCSFQQIIRKITGFWELATTPGENPGSATAN